MAVTAASDILACTFVLCLRTTCTLTTTDMLASANDSGKNKRSTATMSLFQVYEAALFGEHSELLSDFQVK